MKRSSLLFFALILIFNLYPQCPALAVSNLSNGVIQLLNDVDGNGYINRGDTIRVSCTAVFVAPATAWVIAPTVDLSQIGIANTAMADQGGGNFRVDITLTNWNQAVNYIPRNITIYCRADDEIFNNTVTAAPTFDLAQVEGTGASAINDVTLTNRARLGERLRIQITDNRYQTDPLGGTICTVNLTPIGGNAATPMPYVGGNVFRVLSDPIPAGINYTGPLTITLNDPMLGHAAVGYLTANVIVDSGVPTVDFGNTSVVIQSGNPTALPGDVLRITAAVTAYDNETVTVFCADLNGLATSVPALNPAFPMPLISSSGLGNPAVWQIDVTLRDADLKSPSLLFTFTFTDDDGNVITVPRYISIDLDAPNVLNPTARVWLPEGTLSPTNTATTTCRLEFIASVSIDINPDTLTASIDLSEIGASAQYPMTRVGMSNNYRAYYTVPQGNLEDILGYEFTISVRDAAGNLVAQSTAPQIRIDNKPPVLSNMQLTSSNPVNPNIIRAGDQFTVQCTVTDIESGSASVDLSRLGIAPPYQLLPVGSNVYRRTWTLPPASTSLALDPIVDEYVALRVYANDTVDSGSYVGHIVDGYTGQLMIDNDAPQILTATYTSVHNQYPTDALGYVRIGDSISFYAQVASDPITVTINMLNLGQGNAENMWQSTNPAFPLDDGWYEYNLNGDVPEGLLNRQTVQFRVTATDDAGNADTYDVSVPIDNRPVKVSNFDVDVTYQLDRNDTDISIINLNKHVKLTVTLTQPVPAEADPVSTPHASATIDLSNFGLGTAEAMTYDAGLGAYTYEFDNTLPQNIDLASYRFQTTIKDISGNRTLSQSAMRRVDNWPPTFNASPTANVVGGGSSAKIGDSILFRADIKNNENTAPVIDLDSLGLSSAQAMTLISSIGGVNRYEYTATISAGTSNGTDTAWIITARDNDLNYATDTTNLLTVDSSAPQVATALTVSGNSQAGIIRAGENLTFTLRLATDTTIASDSVTVDLRMIGIDNAVYQITNTDTYATGSLWVANVTSLATTTEYTNVRFTATITDASGNVTTSNSQLFSEIDCRPVTISNFGLTLWQDNGVVNPGFAGPDDVVMIWASATYYQDAVLTGNLATGAVGLEVDYASATLTYNSTRNRHEGLITIATNTVTSWPVVAGNLIYRVRAVDNVSNITSTAYTTCPDFVVRNIMPTALTSGINLSPNYYLATTSTDVLIYNLASSTTGDGLIASITFADDLVIHKAWLDFREFGTGTVDLKTDNSSSAVTISGYTVNRLPPIEDGVSRRVWLYAMDQAGNATYTSERVFIDNIAPTLVSAEFDGEILSVALSENFDNNSFVVENWQIIGSSTLGAPASLTFNATAPNEILDWSSFQLELDISHLRTMAGWASTPIYLKVTNTATSAVTDMWGNELRPVEYFPITITDSSWREPARITHFTVEQNWPNSVNIDLLFSKNMDQDSLAATAAVLLLATDTSGTFATNVDYNLGYVFQASSTAQASDTFAWQSPTHLRITLCETGRRWVAKKLTNNTSQKLYFACRNTLRPFVIDFLGKPVTHIDPTSPLPGVDNRPVSNFAFRGPPDDPKLSIGERSLVLSASDLLLLSNSPYNNNETVPYLIEPTPTFNNRVTSFHGKIILHESNSGSTQVLEFEPLATTTNQLFASTTVTLKLTDDDLVNILALYQANPSPIWEMTIQAGAFTNLWGNSNLAYLPSSFPGAMQVATGTPAASATLAAVSMSDKPPVSAKLAGELIFEVEVFPPDIDGIPLPLQWQTTPKAGIFLQDAGNTWVASGTFVNYTERTVDGRLRGVFRYQNTAALPTNLQSVPAVVNIYGVTDIFGNSKDLTASYAYDLNTKNDGAVEGFTDAASAGIILDTQKPVVMVNQIIPNDYIGKIPAGSIFRVNFDEDMNQAIIPTLTLATSTQTMTFTFSSWSASATAEFTNDSAFTSTLPNGTWYYQVTGGTDIAGNIMTTTGATAFPVQVRTYAPEVSAGNVVLRTVQTTISTAELINEPWSKYLAGGSAVFSVTYDAVPIQNPPHFLQIYDPISNVVQGEVALSAMSGNLATATIANIAATTVGPVDFAVRIRDSLNNRTDKVLDMVYDGLAPDMTVFDISGLGVGSTTAEYTYYNPLSGDLLLNFEAVTTDTLRLAVFNGAATSTQLLNDSGTPGNYFLATGSTYADGPYTFTVVDLAGNIGTGLATRKVYADASAPVLLSIVPEYSVGQPGPYYIGKCLASETRLVVTFSEPMDADPAQEPTLVLTRNASTINWRFVGWVNPAVASTAIYENIGDITSALETGQYQFTMTGGRDLAFNTRTPASDQTKTIEVYTAGPYVNITTYTNQSHIYGTTPQTNLGYNPFYTAPGSATIRIDFIGTTFDTYDLIVSSGSTEVGSYTGLPLPTPSIIPFEPTNASWSWAGIHPQDANYTLRVRDSGGDYSPSFTFRYDTATPTINTAIAMTTGSGIATDTEYAPVTVLYYSPAAGDANFNITTINPDVMRLLVFNGIATHVADMTPGLTNHNALWSSLSNAAAIVDGPYMVTGVDTAGNIADGTASTSIVMIDTVPPQLASAVVMIGGLPSTSTGVVATNTGVFRLTFDSGMNTSAASPTLTLASDSGTITMRATSWISSTTCEFTNTVAIDKSFAPGTYSYQVSGALDYAGNTNAVPAMGSFTVVLFTEEPDLTAFQVVSNQTALYGTQAFINRPLSFEAYAAGPDIATLTLSYRTAAGHPYQEPHLIRIYNSANVLASEAVVPGAVGGISSFTLNSSALGNPPAGATESYSFRLIDNIGNISATYTLPIVYDSIRPEVATAAISTVSNAISSPLYYNEQLHGALNVRFETSASAATDSLVLAIATTTALPYTWNMYTNLTTGISTYSISVASAASLAEGHYVITAADMAGNFATGTASITMFVVDRTAPVVLTATTSTTLPVVSATAGGATFTVQFNEHMNELSSATPALVIATTTAQIACTFKGWIASDTAQFVNTATISNALPQGDYDCRVIAWDLTGNKLDTNNAGTMVVQSRGPIIASWSTVSYQQTTASETLASGLEMLTNQPFSVDVWPNAATITIELAAAPDAEPIHLHFMQDNTTVASYPLVLNGMIASFTWSDAASPTPTLATTYTMRIADDNGDFSLESLPWRMDNASPSVQLLTITGGELATSSVYFNPARHRYITTRFNTAESEAPRLRIRGSNSTDTFELTSAGTNQWSTNFEGLYSRPNNLGNYATLPDATYALDMVDRAGNIAFLASDGLPIDFEVVIDTLAPIVATYSTKVAGNNVTSFAPAAGNLDITAVSAETLVATGVYWIEVLDNTGVRVNRLPLTDSVGSFTATWDGTNSDGDLVLDGYYTLRATDYAGNPTINSITVFARTTPFRVSTIEQVSATSARMWFNHDIDDTTFGGTPITSVPALAISGLVRDQERAITFNVNPAFTHDTSYVFTVATNTIKSVFGSGISETASTAVLVADGRGPVITGVSFHGLTGQQEFRVEFDENYTAASAGDKANYTLTSASGAMSIVLATTQSDLRSVVLTADPALIENADYTITANNIVDNYGNATSSSLAFKGRDLTPPVLTVSAFSNPANENDIIVVVTSNETLKSAPNLSVAQSNAPVITTVMQQGAEPKSYMIGVSLSPSYAGNGTLSAEAQDVAGNTGYGTNTFTVAYVSSTRASIVMSADSMLALNFSEQSLKSDATVKILQHKLEKSESTGGAIRTSLQRQLRAAMGSLRGSAATDTVLPNHVELIPVSDAYEIGILKSKVNNGFNVNLLSNVATSTTGIALFNQVGDSWNFVTASRDKEGAFTARTGSSQIFAIMRDIAAPRLNLAADMELSEPFRTARPEFRGRVEEAGSGIDPRTVIARIDGGPGQPVQVDSNGNFVFTPIADLVAGDHDLVIKAADRTGNTGLMAATRFQIVMPLSISQIVQYPNPANRRMFIRISANRNDLTSDLVTVTIYDVAGHKVDNLDYIKAVKENVVGQRYLYDIPWDLRNSEGKPVANGVYFARIVVRDPDNPSIKTKRNFKLAVLR
ncbi:MAG: hypothetical protein GQF41_2198 [Candidatus Rifleibacterium amylolyticum]|nr:MAG: hypothetical protein GQF41_2198 [Candidatus Rifleibacterium amylolyticum]